MADFRPRLYGPGPGLIAHSTGRVDLPLRRALPGGLGRAAALRLPYSVLAGNAPVKYTFGRLRKFIRNFTELYKTVLLWPRFYDIVYKRKAFFAAD